MPSRWGAGGSTSLDRPPAEGWAISENGVSGASRIAPGQAKATGAGPRFWWYWRGAFGPTWKVGFLCLAQYHGNIRTAAERFGSPSAQSACGAQCGWYDFSTNFSATADFKIPSNLL